MTPFDDKTYRFEGFTLDLRRGCLCNQDSEIALRPKSFAVLCYLVKNAGRLVPKNEIIKTVWADVIVNDESLTRCVSDVRLALGDREQRIIKTLPRRGYLLDVPISEFVSGSIRDHSKVSMPAAKHRPVDESELAGTDGSPSPAE
jgi:DNA-binding winged helix-turn-helix (wHTH) protein